MSLNLGVNVIETDGRATPSIQPAEASVAAFIINAAKGVPGRVEMITNWRQFIETFGGYTNNAYGAYAVHGFFENGGSKAYVTRIMPGDAEPASTVLKDDSGNDVLKIKAGNRGSVYPGTWGKQLSIKVAVNTQDNTVHDLVVLKGEDVLETWRLEHGAADVEALINDDLQGSRYIVLEKTADGEPQVTAMPQPLANGKDGVFTSETLATAARDALSLFDIYQVQLVCCPESADDAWVRAAISYCNQRGDCVFVGHTPAGNNAATAKAYGKLYQAEKVYGALYFPWIMVSDPRGAPVWIPPTGHILGVYARTERERGVWKAPAGNAAQMNGARDVRFHITDEEHTDLVKNNGVNAVRYIPGQGIVIDSSRTLSTSPLWLYVNVRLLFNFVKSSLMAGLRWVVQEPNNDTLWNKIKYNSVTPFLMDLWRRGAFGPGKPEDVFTVKVDAENNPPASIQQGILNAEVYFYPSRPAETIVLTIGQQEGGATAAESA